jgi:hypothetical protein
MLRILVVAFPLLALAGTARADDDLAVPDHAANASPRYYIAGGVSGVSTDAATMLGSYRLAAGKPVIGPLWVTAHLARSVEIEPDVMDPGAAHATEVGGGMELRRCRFPWFVCGAVGVNAAFVIDDHGEVTPALLPHLDGEIGMGNLALRLGLEGRYGKDSGVGASTAIVLRF